jgi:glucokinase
MRAGIDIGGTTTRIAAFYDDTTFALVARYPTPTAYAEQIDRIRAALGGGEWRGVGVSVGAQVTPDGKQVTDAPNLRDYEGQPLTDDLRTALGCEVRLAHDTVCGALAESEAGAMTGVDRFAYVTVSTGTGGALHQRRGRNRLLTSIEFGHQIIDPGGYACACGQRGCLETLTGGAQIARRIGQPPDRINDPEFWGTFADALSIGLINVANLTGVEQIVIGGGIALGRESLLPGLQERVAANRYRSTLRLRLAKLGENAPLIGAVRLHTLHPSALLH